MAHHPPLPHSPPDRELFEAFYRLRARQVMDPTLGRAAFLPPHAPVLGTLDLFARVDHAWILESEDSPRRIRSILLRRDLFRALAPTQASYSRFQKLRFHSLAHGAADCICCFTEGRVLHAVDPDTPCADVVHLMESKALLYLPVIERGEIVGEIGSLEIIQALRRLRENQGAPP